MSSEADRELKDMLAAGWKVAGFQQIMDTTFGDGKLPTVTDTGGYAILLQREADLAICEVLKDGPEMVVHSVQFLTRLGK